MNEDRMNESEEERRLRRRRRLEEMKRQKRRAELIQRRVIPAAALALLIAAATGIGGLILGNRGEKPDNGGGQFMAAGSGYQDRKESYTLMTMPPELASPAPQPAAEPGSEGPAPQQPEAYQAVSTASTAGFPDSIVSEYGVVIDVENGAILAQRNPKTGMSPASMTKVLTVLTAADALGIGGGDWAGNPVLDDTFTITIEITDYSFVNGCSNVGFEVGEKVTVRDLFYGTILSSGADAALGLACYVAGSHEAFVELMNRKLTDLGLSESTHFTNCVGLYDENHYSTVYDIAVILKTASDNPFCRDVLSAHTYTTSATEQHPEGLLISNWFLRRIEDKDTHGEVICGKTGYVTQSKSCAASLAVDVHGKEYICVTAGSSGTRQCINDHVGLYQAWLAAQ